MGEILTVLSGHTEDNSSSNITQIEHNPTDSTDLNSMCEKAWAHDNLRTTTNQVETNNSSQQSNNHNTKVSRGVAQNVASEDILPNCPEDSSQSQATVPAADHKEAEHIAHVLQAIGDQLNSSATDHLSEEIVEALRSIGDRIDAKLGHSQNFVKMALSLSQINVGHVLLEVMRPRSFVGSLLCTSLQLLLHYKSI